MLHRAPSRRPNQDKPGHKSRKYAEKLMDARHGGCDSPSKKCGLLDSIPEKQRTDHVTPKKPVAFVVRPVSLEIKQHGSQRSLLHLGKPKPLRPVYQGTLRLTHRMSYAAVQTEVTYQILRHCFRDGEKLLGSIDFTIALDRGGMVVEITEGSWPDLRQELGSLDAVLRVGFEIVAKGKVIEGLGKRVERCVKAMTPKAHPRRAEVEEVGEVDGGSDRDGRNGQRNRLGRLQYFKLPY